MKEENKQEKTFKIKSEQYVCIQELSGWWSCYVAGIGFVKADSYSGLKRMIKKEVGE